MRTPRRWLVTLAVAALAATAFYPAIAAERPDRITPGIRGSVWR
jgi:hypothetical protein